MAWRVVVDFGRCEANALCMGLAPEVFLVENDESFVLLVDEPDDSMRPQVDAAVVACPRQAISVVE